MDVFSSAISLRQKFDKVLRKAKNTKATGREMLGGVKFETDALVSE